MSISDFAEDGPSEGAIFKEDSPEEESQNQVTQPVAEAPDPAPTTAQASAITQSILSKIKPIGSGARLKMFVYGEPGSTKSSFAATAKNNLIIDFEDGLISAKTSPNGIAEGVQSFQYSNFDEFVELIKAFHANDPGLSSFTTVTIDTLSDLQKRGLAEVTEREWQKRPSANRYVPETEHHQENNEKIIRIIRVLRDLDRDIIITSHSKTVEPKNKPAKTYADFSESLSNRIMGMMDIVGFMSMQKIDDKMVPVMRVVSDGTIAAKTRIPLPEEIANPTFEQIKKVWNEQNNQ